MSKFAGVIAGAFEIGLGLFLEFATFGIATPLTTALIIAGAGTVLAGIGTALSQSAIKGFVGAVRNPTAPWEYVYGRVETGGVEVYYNPWPKPGNGSLLDTPIFVSGGGNDQVMDLVMVLAAHRSKSVDVLLFDQQRVQIDSTQGLCSTAGTAVTWTAGATNFEKAPYFVSGVLIGINGVSYQIAAVTSPTHITLTTSAGTQANVPYIGGGSAPAGAAPGSGTSFTPVQQNVGPGTGGIPNITRLNGLVTVTLHQNIPYLIEGDQIQIAGIGSGYDPSLNGTFQVQNILVQTTGSLIFTYLCGGANVTVTGQGQVNTLWADYGRSVYFEVLLGTQALGQTFAGMLYGTPSDGDLSTFISPEHTGNVEGSDAPNPWTAYCSGQGKTQAMLRLHYEQAYYKGGLPAIAFLMHGKCDILDPRIGPFAVSAASWSAGLLTFTTATNTVAAGNLISITGASVAGFNIVKLPALAVTSTTVTVAMAASPGTFTGSATLRVSTYTENAALCIADYVTMDQEIGGYGYEYGTDTDVTYAPLIAAANTCDEAVPLAGPFSPPMTEPAYACNGKFNLDEPRGEILGNMLMSCAGRISEVGGQVTIWPAAWTGNQFAIGSDPGGGVVALGNFTGPGGIAAGSGIAWTGIGVRDLFNGVRGTYISPANKWSPSDFPPYAQDSIHGYTDGPAQYDYDANLAADGGDRRWKYVSLRFTISPAAAQRIAKIELLRCRLPLLGAAKLLLNMAAYVVTPLDLGLVTIPVLGWTAKQIEVTNARLRIEEGKEDGAGPSMLVELDVCSADPNQYEWDTSEELTAQGYQQPSGDWAFYATELVPGWTSPFPLKPGYLEPLLGDAYYPGPELGSPPMNAALASFGMQVIYGTDAQGNATANLEVTAIPPPNDLSTLIGPAQITCAAGTSGNLPAGTYVLACSALDTGTPVRNAAFGTPIKITIPEESPPAANGSIAVTVAWPHGANGGEIYMAGGSTADGYSFQATLSAGTTSITITDFDQSTPGAPDALADHVAAAWTAEVHGGDFSEQAQAVTPTTITIAQHPTDAPMTTNQWAGKVLSLLGKLDPTQALIRLNMPVASSTATAGTSPPEFILTIGPNSLGDQLPDLTTLLEVGDLVVMRLSPTFGPSNFSDPLIANPYYPGGATGVEPGHVAIVLTGPDTGDVQTIGSVSLDGSGHPTIFELAGEWAVQPNAGDLVIVAEAGWGPEAKGLPFTAAARGVAGLVAVSPLVTNLPQKAWVFIIRMQSAQNINGADAYAPMADIFFFGFQGTRTITTSQTGLTTDRIIDADASGGAITYTFVPFSEIPNQTVYIQKSDSSANAVTWQCSESDTINGASSGILAAYSAFLMVTVPA